MADDIIRELSHMGSLAGNLTFLLAEAAGLPDPGTVTIYGILDGHVHDQVLLQFPPVAASTEAVAEWALRFGGVIQSKPLCEGNRRMQYVRTRFTWQEFLRVEAFTIFPLPQPEATTSAGQDSELVTEPPF